MLIPTLLFNYERGGLQPDGSRELRPLQHAIGGVRHAPALIVLNEAKECRRDGQAGLNDIAEAVSDELGRGYVGLLGHLDRGEFPPAVFYDPTRLRLRNWYVGAGEYEDRRNVARFKTKSGATLFVVAQHWHPYGGDLRVPEAKRMRRWGYSNHPTLLAGDLNGTASGPHLPTIDWDTAPYVLRESKGRQDSLGQWKADTDAVDHLIGRWEDGRRVGGCGFQAVCELAAATGTDPQVAYAPTTNETGSRLLIDWLLANPKLAEAYVPDSYRVMATSRPYPSDHEPVYCEFDL